MERKIKKKHHACVCEWTLNCVFFYADTWPEKNWRFFFFLKYERMCLLSLIVFFILCLWYAQRIYKWNVLGTTVCSAFDSRECRRKKKCLYSYGMFIFSSLFSVQFHFHFFFCNFQDVEVVLYFVSTPWLSNNRAWHDIKVHKTIISFVLAHSKTEIYTQIIGKCNTNINNNMMFVVVKWNRQIMIQTNSRCTKWNC